jgi:regulatory protein
VYRIRLVEHPGEEENSPRESLDLIISEAYLPPEFQGRSFSPGASLSPEAEEALCFSQFCQAAEKAALRLIVRAEQCAAALTRKLEQRKHSRDAVKAVLSRLCGMNLVNDSRYAELWLKYRVLRGAKSPRSLINSLRAKGIDQDTAREALQAVLELEAPAEAAASEIEDSLLRRFLTKDPRARSMDRQSLRPLLKSEGFSPAAIELYWEEEAPA